MLTIGGIIDTEENIERLKKSSVLKHKHVTTGKEPILISVPHLTLREKQWIDSHALNKFRKLPFELDEKQLENYKKWYKFYPTYFEAIT